MVKMKKTELKLKQHSFDRAFAECKRSKFTVTVDMLKMYFKNRGLNVSQQTFETLARRSKLCSRVTDPVTQELLGFQHLWSQREN